MKYFFLLIFTLFLIHFELLAQNDSLKTYLISEDTARFIYLEKSFLGILHDSTGKLTIEQVAKNSNFHPQSFQDMTSHFVKTFWLKVKLKNNLQKDINIFVEGANSSYLHDVVLYEAGNQAFKVQKTGTLIPWSERDGEKLDGMLPVKLASGEEKILFLQMKMDYSYIERDNIKIQFKIFHETMFYKQKYTDFQGNRANYLYRTLFVIYVGILLVMALYNLGIYITVGEKSYLYYVLFLFFQTIGATSQNKMMFYMFADYPVFTWGLLFHVGMFYDTFFSIFIFNYLNIRQLQKKIYQILLTILIFRILAYLLYDFFRILFYYSEFLFALQAFSALLLFASLLMATAYLVYKKYPLAKNFFIAIAPWTSTNLIIIILVMLKSSVSFQNVEFAFFMLTSVFMVVMFSNALSQKFQQIRQEVAEKALEKERLEKEKAIEIQQLISQKNEELESKVQDRTLELQETNIELESILYKVQSQKREIEKKNEAITASISYAKRIQIALLQIDKQTTSILPEHFILFKPKDVVSGDFYRMRFRDEKLFIIAADCTGHGVPGALMSMIGVNSLRQIATERRMTDPALMLNLLHKEIREALQQDSTENRDGMDISICVLTPKANQDPNKKPMEFEKMEYAGAMNSMYYIQNNEFAEIKADKKSIGGKQEENERLFKKHIIDLSVPTTFYIFTDGFRDQFGGENEQKLMSKNFKKLLFSIYHLPMKEQQIFLENHFKQWKGANRQIDDVLVIGVRV